MTRRLRCAMAVSVGGGGLLLILLQQGVAYFPWGIGVMVVIVGLQIALMMQGKRPAASQAQQLYLAGQFEEAVQALEQQLATDPHNLDALTLLGNTYRQIGQLEASEQRLREAVAYNPTHWMALYGLGRTLMVQGAYQEAVTTIETALQHGGRKSLRAELALALYYAEALIEAKQAANLAARRLSAEGYRILMTNYLLYVFATHEAERALAKQVMQRTAEGLVYWQAQAERFAQTPYGQRVAADVMTIQRILEEQQ
ncbi:MAG: tetratricopeptide repeat protein [Anaerolineales bacterium]|nr:tetratricopeptide repeat protein [Anaerolineales bacterium]